MPRSSNAATLDAAAMRRAVARRSVLVDAAHRRVVGDATRRRTSPRCRRSPTVCSASHDRATRPSCTSTATSAARHHASVPGRTARWKSASSAVSLRRGSMTISARSGSRAISLSVVRAWGRPCDCHGFLPMNSATSACSMSPRTIVPEHLGVDPELAGLLLGQSVRPVAAAERPQGGAAVRAAEVVPLAAAAEVEDRLAAVGVAHLGEALPRPPRSRCPSRSPRRCRRAAAAAGWSGGARPFW